jgi:hypothetical protein
MNPLCDHCQLKYDRDAGYFLGSIYINYGLTALIVAIGYPLLFFGFGVAPRPLLLAGMAFCILFPLWFFRYARSLWIGFDQFFDPSQEEQNASDHDG